MEVGKRVEIKFKYGNGFCICFSSIKEITANSITIEALGAAPMQEIYVVDKNDIIYCKETNAKGIDAKTGKEVI